MDASPASPRNNPRPRPRRRDPPIRRRPCRARANPPPPRFTPAPSVTSASAAPRPCPPRARHPREGAPSRTADEVVPDLSAQYCFPVCPDRDELMRSSQSPSNTVAPCGRRRGRPGGCARMMPPPTPLASPRPGRRTPARAGGESTANSARPRESPPGDTRTHAEPRPSTRTPSAASTPRRRRRAPRRPDPPPSSPPGDNGAEGRLRSVPRAARRRRRRTTTTMTTTTWSSPRRRSRVPRVSPDRGATRAPGSRSPTGPSPMRGEAPERRKDRAHRHRRHTPPPGRRRRARPPPRPIVRRARRVPSSRTWRRPTSPSWTPPLRPLTRSD